MIIRMHKSFFMVHELLQRTKKSNMVVFVKIFNLKGLLIKKNKQILFLTIFLVLFFFGCSLKKDSAKIEDVKKDNGTVIDKSEPNHRSIIMYSLAETAILESKPLEAVRILESALKYGEGIQDAHPIPLQKTKLSRFV